MEHTKGLQLHKDVIPLPAAKLSGHTVLLGFSRVTTFGSHLQIDLTQFSHWLFSLFWFSLI